MMRYVRVKITRDTHTVYNRACPPWEIPVLEFIFEPGNVVPEDKFDEVEGQYPDARSEYDRLTRAYGSDAENGIPFVAQVFGQAGQGLRALAREIEAAKVADAAVNKARAGGRRRAAAPQDDPLLA